MNTKAVEPKTKLKIHVNKSLAIEPPELAGFYVDSVFTSCIVCPRVDVALFRAFLNSQWRIDQAFLATLSASPQARANCSPPRMALSLSPAYQKVSASRL